MKRQLATALIFLITALTALSVVSAQFAGLTITTTQRANLRTGPGTNFNVVTIVPAGTTMSLDGRTDDGTWVRGITSGGQIGWISSGVVGLSIGQLRTLPIIGVNNPFTLSAPAQSAPQTSVTTSATGGTGSTVAATARVNMRSGPGTGFRRVGGLNPGDPINVDGRDSSGAWVRGINRTAVVGWVFASYLSIDTAAVIALPVVSVETPFTLAPPGGGAVAQTAPQQQPVAPVISTAPVRGFSYGGHVANLGDNTANFMRRAGMTWVKIQWRYTDGQNAESVRGLIDNAHARGFRILIGVVGLPGELNNGGYFDRYAGFVAGVAGLGADAIEIWNEPNLDREWPAPIDPVRYTDLLRVSYGAIKARNASTLVISGAPAPTGAEGAFPGRVMNDNRFLAGMASAGAANYMDCVGVHYNEGIVPPDQSSGDPRGNDYYTRFLRPMMDVYYGAFGGARPLCFTELGYLSPEGYGQLPPLFAWAQNVTVAQQAAWLDRAVAITGSSGRVRLLIIWNIDFTGFGDDPVGGYALIRPGNVCPACDALGS